MYIDCYKIKMESSFEIDVLLSFVVHRKCIVKIFGKPKLFPEFVGERRKRGDSDGVK